jgi:hypothetical protein
VKGPREIRVVGITCALSLAWVGRAAAAPPRVRVEASSDDPVSGRLASELRSSGLVVIVAGPSPPGEPKMATDEPVDAIVRVVPGLGVRVWWVDHGSILAGEAGVGDAIESRPGEDLAIGAVRTAEVIRARLLRVDPALPAAAPTTVPPGDAASARLQEGSRAAPPRPTWGFGLEGGGLALFHTGDVPPTVGLALMPSFKLWSRLIVRGLVTVPLALPTVSAAEGQARASEWLAGAGVASELLPSDSSWEASVGVGAAAARVVARGAAVAPFVGRSSGVWTGVPFVSATASHSIGSPYVAIGADLFVGTATPEVAVRFGDRDVARWGGLLVGILVGLKLHID